MNFTPQQIAIAALNAASLGFELAGQPRLSGMFTTLANGLQSGANIDAHMAVVAEKLKASTSPPTDADWADVTSRIQSDSDRLQGA